MKLQCFLVSFLFFSDLWEFYLPYLYSCISLMGGLLLLSKMFHLFTQSNKIYQTPY